MSQTRPHASSRELGDWRRRRLVAAGFEPALALRLARDDVDLHELLVLVDRGCAPDLAARILAPLRPAPAR